MVCYATQIRQGLERLKADMEGLHELAMGGTAVGTGLNAPPGFDVEVAAKLAELTGYPFRTAENKFSAQGGSTPWLPPVPDYGRWLFHS